MPLVSVVEAPARTDDKRRQERHRRIAYLETIMHDDETTTNAAIFSAPPPKTRFLRANAVTGGETAGGRRRSDEQQQQQRQLVVMKSCTLSNDEPLPRAKGKSEENSSERPSLTALSICNVTSYHCEQDEEDKGAAASDDSSSPSTKTTTTVTVPYAYEAYLVRQRQPAIEDIDGSYAYYIHTVMDYVEENMLDHLAAFLDVSDCSTSSARRRRRRRRVQQQSLVAPRQTRFRGGAGHSSNNRAAAYSAALRPRHLADHEKGGGSHSSSLGDKVVGVSLYPRDYDVAEPGECRAAAAAATENVDDDVVVSTAASSEQEREKKADNQDCISVIGKLSIIIVRASEDNEDGVVEPDDRRELSSSLPEYYFDTQGGQQDSQASESQQQEEEELLIQAVQVEIQRGMEADYYLAPGVIDKVAFVDEGSLLEATSNGDSSSRSGGQTSSSAAAEANRSSYQAAKSHGWPRGRVMGIVVMVLSALVLVSLLLALFARRRRRRRSRVCRVWESSLDAIPEGEKENSSSDGAAVSVASSIECPKEVKRALGDDPSGGAAKTLKSTTLPTAGAALPGVSKARAPPPSSVAASRGTTTRRSGSSTSSLGGFFFGKNENDSSSGAAAPQQVESIAFSYSESTNSRDAAPNGASSVASAAPSHQSLPKFVEHPVNGEAAAVESTRQPPYPLRHETEQVSDQHYPQPWTLEPQPSDEAEAEVMANAASCNVFMPCGVTSAFTSSGVGGSGLLEDGDEDGDEQIRPVELVRQQETAKAKKPRKQETTDESSTYDGELDAIEVEVNKAPSTSSQHDQRPPQERIGSTKLEKLHHKLQMEQEFHDGPTMSTRTNLFNMYYISSSESSFSQSSSKRSGGGGGGSVGVASSVSSSSLRRKTKSKSNTTTTTRRSAPTATGSAGTSRRSRASGYVSSTTTEDSGDSSFSGSDTYFTIGIHTNDNKKEDQRDDVDAGERTDTTEEGTTSPTSGNEQQRVEHKWRRHRWSSSKLPPTPRRATSTLQLGII